MSLFLPPHVFFCERDEALVFLDLAKDEYILVQGRQAASLRSHTTRAGLSVNASPCDGDLADLADLVSSGLLTHDASAGRIVSPTSVEPVAEPLVEAQEVSSAHLAAIHLVRFLAACSVASLLLRFASIKRIVTRVQRRKERYGSGRLVDVQKARHLTATFRKLRMFFPRRYLCLFEALALLEFLACYEIFPRWVFGVRLEPWGAHCWVQHGEMVFNDGVEEVSGYTPVMAI